MALDPVGLLFWTRLGRLATSSRRTDHDTSTSNDQWCVWVCLAPQIENRKRQVLKYFLLVVILHLFSFSYSLSHWVCKKTPFLPPLVSRSGSLRLRGTPRLTPLFSSSKLHFIQLPLSQFFLTCWVVVIHLYPIFFGWLLTIMNGGF